MPPLPVSAQSFIDRARELFRQGGTGSTGTGTAGTGNVDGVRSLSFADFQSSANQIFGRLTTPHDLFHPTSPGSKNDIGWLLNQDPNYQQRLMNDELLALHKTAKSGARVLPDDANNFAYLFVPGLFTKHYIGYFSENMRRMKQRGCNDVVLSKIDTDLSVRANAEVLKKEIEEIEKRTGKKVVLVGHSKGGVDAGAALQLFPELQSKVKAFVSLQAPFGGTPVASDINENNSLKDLFTGFIKNIFRGDPTSLTDLSYQARRTFLGDRVTFTNNVATFSLGSATTDAFSAVALGALYGRERYNKVGDGLVLRDDAIIPGSRGIVLLDELDHAGPAMSGLTRPKFRPGDLTEAMIALALKHSP